MDFTLKTYVRLLNALQTQGFFFIPFCKYQKKYSSKTILLRHDVDKLPQNALRFAQIEHKLGIKSSYYFRAVSESWDESVIVKIAELGHEIGYHYEDVSLAVKRQQAEGGSLPREMRRRSIFHCGRKELVEHKVVNEAIVSFGQNLERLKGLVSVKTICMHGSPLCQWDSRLLWKYYDYRDFLVEGEPYFDVNFEDMLYLTDTGRRWDGDKYSVRDKPRGSSFAKATDFVRRSGLRPSKAEDKGRKAEGIYSFEDWVVKPKPGSLINMMAKGVEFQSRYNFRSTNDIIRAAEKGELPDKIMMTFHPQRWTDKAVPWVKELVWQGMKNQAKRLLIKLRD